jgi:hypothetical protein
MDYSSTTVSAPRGVPGLAPLTLDMSKVYAAESRINETKAVNPMTAPELKATFNEACGITTKYIAWLQYEILMAKKYLALAKAEVILDKLPSKVQELKNAGIKDNSDFREALVARDTSYQNCQNTLYALEAVKALLESKVKTFDRAYWDCKSTAEEKDHESSYLSTSLKQGSLSISDNEAVAFAIGVTKL